MLYCPNDSCPYVDEYGKRSTYQDHVEKCLDCGTPLAAGDPPPAHGREESEPPVEVVTVATYDSVEHARLAKMALDSAGIPCSLSGEHAAGIGGAGALLHGVPLRVPGVYAVEARELLEASETVEEPPDEAFETDELDDVGSTCPHCGGEFEVRKTLWASVIAGIVGEGASRSGTREERRCRTCGAVFEAGAQE